MRPSISSKPFLLGTSVFIKLFWPSDWDCRHRFISGIGKKGKKSMFWNWKLRVIVAIFKHFGNFLALFRDFLKSLVVYSEKKLLFYFKTFSGSSFSWNSFEPIKRLNWSKRKCQSIPVNKQISSTLWWFLHFKITHNVGRAILLGNGSIFLNSDMSIWNLARKMGRMFYRALGDLKFSPISRGPSQIEGLKFCTILRGDKGQSLLKFVRLFQVKFNFSVEDISFRIV